MMTPLEAELFEIVLILNLRNVPAYGVSINDQLTERRGGREISAGPLYTGLQSLVSKGFLKDKMTEPVPERGWRGKRLYFVTADGSSAYREWQQNQVLDALPGFASVPGIRIRLY
jgi:DNA-binding PadR family transcriptional regulator